ncbi:MAG: hypothetical protein M1324_03660 [Patescibacteria group bacterium]|nr:hypothetical protein [Patescibacteria group bacterium]
MKKLTVIVIAAALLLATNLTWYAVLKRAQEPTFVPDSSARKQVDDWEGSAVKEVRIRGILRMEGYKDPRWHFDEKNDYLVVTDKRLCQLFLEGLQKAIKPRLPRLEDPSKNRPFSVQIVRNNGESTDWMGFGADNIETAFSVTFAGAFNEVSQLFKVPL